MKIAVPRQALLVAAYSVLAGCGGGMAGSRLDPSPPLTQRVMEDRSNRSSSWMATGTANETLLYISDIGAETVDVFTYPKGALVGALTGFEEPNGECVDAKGNVWIADTYALEIVEYAHGGTKPIAKLSDANYPVSCSIDPTTNDLAATNLQKPAEPQGSVSVYKNSSGTPTVIYSDIEYYPYFCSYDDSGNLYLDGFDNDGPVTLGELARNSDSITTVATTQEIGWPGGVLWYNKHLNVGDQYANKFVKSEPYPNVVYVMKVKDATATVLKTVPLKGGMDVVEFWISGGTAVGPDAVNEDVGYWKFPAGGEAFKSLSGFYEPVGVTISPPHAAVRSEGRFRQ
jgi:hypothetical protein